MTEQLYRAKLADSEGEFEEVVLYVGMNASAQGWDGPRVGFIPAESTVYIDELKEYLDTAILHWRAKQRLGDAVAKYYIDAFQSVRVTVIGAELP